MEAASLPLSRVRILTFSLKFVSPSRNKQIWPFDHPEVCSFITPCILPRSARSTPRARLREPTCFLLICSSSHRAHLMSTRAYLSTSAAGFFSHDTCERAPHTLLASVRTKGLSFHKPLRLKLPALTPAAATLPGDRNPGMKLYSQLVIRHQFLIAPCRSRHIATFFCSYLFFLRRQRPPPLTYNSCEPVRGPPEDISSYILLL